jgi:hypothetical protein
MGLRRMLTAPPQFEPSITAVRSPAKRAVTRAYIVMAGWQKAYADRHIGDWSSPPASPQMDVEVITLASERDRAELMRMVHSFLTQVGTPTSFVVVSDGTLSRDTADHVRKLSTAVEVRALDHYAADSRGHPLMPRLLRGDFPFGAKIPLLVQPLASRPRLYVDTDIEFFRGGHRLRALIDDEERRPRFMLQPGAVMSSYDLRMTDGLSMIVGVNAGFCLLKETIDWSLALDRLNRVIDEPHVLSEQTAFGIAISQAAGLPLPGEDFVLKWDDLGVPWDSYARRDIVLRHYASTSRRWKLWLRGGPKGARTLPRAAFDCLVGVQDHGR